MCTIAILCIATGPYSVFWEKFFQTFERNFLVNTQKHYYVFSDDENILNLKNPRVHAKYLNPEPWPLATLLKYHHFLTIAEELENYDYLYQTNINMECIHKVKEEDFLPEDESHPLIFTQHFGYCNKKKYYYPYDRNKKSLAYIPYNKGEMYVYGAMNGGKTLFYLKFMKELDDRILQDLARGIIAQWHDESHVNHYVATHNDYRILSAAFCYPEDTEASFEIKIKAMNKEKYFNIKQFKNSDKIQKKYSLLYKIKNRLNPMIEYILIRSRYYRDTLLHKRIHN